MKTIIIIAFTCITMSSMSQVYAPNTITPNRDGLNEQFYIYTADTLDYFLLQIWDSYGNKLLETNDPSLGWPGDDIPSFAWYIVTWRTKDSIITNARRGHINCLQ